MDNDGLYQIQSNYYCVGIEIKNNKVVKVSPIIYWMLDKDFGYIINYIKYKNFNIIKIC